MSADVNAVIGWVTPTAAWRLCLCPASASHSVGPYKPEPGPVGNAGQAAHRALERWIGSKSFLTRPDSLAQTFDDVCSSSDVQAGELQNGRVTRARLKARGPQLAALLASAGPNATIACEEPLVDEHQRLWGVPDVVVRGSSTMVLDLKTGADATNDLAASVRTQLLLYGHLFRSTFGALPELTAAFSLSHGLIKIAAGPEAVDLAVDSMAVARLKSDANPTPDGCRYCARRFACEPHWLAVETGVLVDALEGVVTESKTSESGLVALRLTSPATEHLVTHVPLQTIGGPVALGSHVRIVRAIPLSEGDGHARWRGGPSTATRTG